eukprot:jgi/Bigna1/82525/fgenesh1_pg.93_\
MEELLEAGGFLILLRIGGAIMAPIYASLLGELLIGTIMGPHGLDIIPDVNAVRLIGSLGLVLLVFEGGLAVDTAQRDSLRLLLFCHVQRVGFIGKLGLWNQGGAGIW